MDEGANGGQTVIVDQKGKPWAFNLLDLKVKIPNFSNSPIIASAVGNKTTYFLNLDGKMFGMSNSAIKKPVLLEYPPKIVSFAAAVYTEHLFFLDDEHKVWFVGDNLLFNFSRFFSTSLTDAKLLNSIFPTIPPIRTIAAGNRCGFCIDFDGGVWTVGTNTDGILGHISNGNTLSKIPNIPPMRDVSSSWHTLFLDEEGCVWSTGRNSNGQLGFKILDVNGTVSPLKIGTLPPILAIAAGTKHSLFLDCNGEVWGCGFNKYGQLGLGIDYSPLLPTKIEGLPPILAISCVRDISLFVDENFSLWYCGYQRIYPYQAILSPQMLPKFSCTTECIKIVEGRRETKSARK